MDNANHHAFLPAAHDAAPRPFLDGLDYRVWDTAIVLSVATGYLTAPFSDVRAMLAYMAGAGDDLPDTGAMLVAPEAAKALYDIHPWLTHLPPLSFRDEPDDVIDGWVGAVSMVYGDLLEAPTLASYRTREVHAPTRFVVEVSKDDEQAMATALVGGQSTAAWLHSQLRARVREAGGPCRTAVETLDTNHQVRREEADGGLITGPSPVTTFVSRWVRL